MKPTLTQSRLKEMLAYDFVTGVFTWKVWSPRRPIGSVAGAVDAYGYVVVRVDKWLYKAHRLAWLYVTGEWPAMRLDHINRVKSDNRWCNLREATQSQNMHNVAARAASKSGFSGVIWRADRLKWYAQIRIGYKTYRLGAFIALEDAIAARKTAEAELALALTNKKAPVVAGA